VCEAVVFDFIVPVQPDGGTVLVKAQAGHVQGLVQLSDYRIWTAPRSNDSVMKMKARTDQRCPVQTHIGYCVTVCFSAYVLPLLMRYLESESRVAFISLYWDGDAIWVKADTGICAGFRLHENPQYLYRKY
jgi:hypothetical protein